MLLFRDRMGDTTIIKHIEGENLANALWRDLIPPPSVIVQESDGTVVSDAHHLSSNRQYTAELIEGYDIGSIREMVRLFQEAPGEPHYMKRRLIFGSGGGVESEDIPMTPQQLVEYVEACVIDTLKSGGFPEADGRLVVGLSGGVDSTSLLIALCAARSVIPHLKPIPVTFLDYDSENSHTFSQAQKTCVELGLECHLAESSLATQIFHLKKPLNEILPELMDKKWAHQVMYIDHHTTRRCLEVVADGFGIKSIALGLHTTDLLAGFLNGFCSGYGVGSVPKRSVPPYDYWFPLAYISKRELHLYHLAKRGRLASHSYPNPWERFPIDRNLYYFLADILQTLWPGIEIQVFEAQRSFNAALVSDNSFSHCRNCGATIDCRMGIPNTSGNCDVCEILQDACYVNGE